MTPHRVNTILLRSSKQLPRLRLGPSTRLVRCFRNYRDTRTPSGVPGGPRTLSTTTDAHLDCVFVENALFYTDPWL